MVSLLQNSTSLRKKPGLAVSSASLTKPKRGIYFFSEYGYLSPARAQQPQPSHHPARFSAVGASGSRNPRSRSVGVPHSHNETPGSATTALQAHFQSAFTNRRRQARPLPSRAVRSAQAAPSVAPPPPPAVPQLLLHSVPRRPSAPRRAVPSPPHPPPPAGCSTSRPPAPRRSAPGPRWPPCQFRASLPSGLHLPGPGARGPR